MSTKTLRKRIALVAVSALGFGVLSTGTAFAGVQTVTISTTAGANTYSTVSPTSRPNVAGVYTAKFNVATATGTGTPTITVKSVISSKPAGSTATVTLADNAATNAGFNTAAVTGTGTGTLVYTSTTATTIAAAAGTLQSNVTFNPDLAGSYTVVTWTDQNNDGAIDADEGYVTKTIVIAAEATVMTITALNAAGATSTAGTADTGALVKISLTNGALATTIAGTELITVSVTGATGTTRIQAGAGGTTAITTLTRNSFDKYGVVYLNVTDDAADTLVFSASGTIGAVVLTQTTSLSFLVPTTVGTKEAATTVSNLTGLGSASAVDVTGSVFVNAIKSTTIGYTFTGAAVATATKYGAAEILKIKVSDGSDGLLLGKTGLAYTTTTTFGTTGVATFSLGVNLVGADYATAPVIGTPVTVGTVLFSPNTANTQTVKAAVGGNNTWTVTQSTFRVVSGGSVTASFTVKDQFGIARASQPITASLNASSRNSGAAGGVAQYLITDASGIASWTYTDAPLTANATLTSDVWTLTSTGVNANAADGGIAYANKTSAATASFVAAITVGTVAIDTPDTTAGVNNTVKATPSAINAGSSGASASVVAISATVTDANGSVYSGIPVVFSVTGTGVAIPTNKVTAYTDNTGTATSSVYAWTTGTYTITATAGGKTSTGLISFGSSTVTNARIVSASVAGNVVTGKVVDRYGNPVSGVPLWASTTSSANIGGLFVQTGSTNAAGTISWVVTGSGDVTVSAVDPSLPAGSTAGQTCAAAGFTSCALTATAIKATVAGTVTTAETYVGSSLAPAGVSKATVSVTADSSTFDTAQAAADAAAEATDAANAATDAANAAAEAADAATAAAQDAADAVAALSAQVATLISGLKAQLTALTNLVIKIQKKVKA